nr:MAG TPA: hypothetical protein [Caudoviricetes sp.]
MAGDGAVRLAPRGRGWGCKAGALRLAILLLFFLFFFPKSIYKFPDLCYNMRAEGEGSPKREGV